MKVTPKDFLRSLTAEQLIAILRVEHPQIGAYIISQCEDPNLVAKALELTSDRLRTDLILRLSVLNATSKPVEHLLKRAIPQWRKIISSVGAPTNGLDIARQVLKKLPKSNREIILMDIGEFSKNLAGSLT